MRKRLDVTKCKCDCHSHNGFLTAKGLAEAAKREVYRPGVDNMDMFTYLDKDCSVSASSPLTSIFDDSVLEQQHRRFHNGS